MNFNTICIFIVVTMLYTLGIYLQDQHLETQALILEYQSRLTAVELENQKTIADFLRSIKTGRENR